MRIGLDARFLTHPQVGGFKTYTQSLVQALVDVDERHEYVVYLDRDPQATMLPTDDRRVTYRVVRGDAPLVGMPWREQVGLRVRQKADRLDLVHFLCNTAPAGLRTRYVMTVHDTIQLEASRVQMSGALRLQRAYSRWAIRRAVVAAAAVITVSEHSALRLQSLLGLGRARIAVVPQAASEVFAPLDEAVRPGARAAIRDALGIERPYLLGVGYEPRKNIPVLIDAFSRLSSRHPHLDLVLVASDATGACRSSFAARARSAGLSARTHILSHPTARDLARLYALCEAFVFPSENEGFGLPVLEAMACGAPVVALDATSVPEVIGDAGVLVAGTDAGHWASAIERVLRDVPLRSALTARAVQRARSFSWRRTARGTLDAYERALSVAPGAVEAGGAGR